MSHFMVTVLVPKDTEDIQEKVAELLAPYDENMKVEAYIYKTRDELTGEKAKVTKQVNSADCPDYLKEYKGKIEQMSLAEFAKGYYGKEVDEEDNVFNTYNERSKWDWYRIGGRWDGEIKGTPRLSDNGFNFSAEHKLLENNICLVSELPKDFSCFAIVTPDGEWHEKGKIGWWAIVINEKEETGWAFEQASLLEVYKDCIAVGVDAHI